MKTNPNSTIHSTTANDVDSCGLTKREYFAGQFAMGFAAAGSTGMPTAEQLAKYITEATDALINALNKA